MLFGGRAAFFPENRNTVRESAQILREGMIEVYPPTAPNKSGVCLGRYPGFCIRHHAARGEKWTACTIHGICGTRSRNGDVTRTKIAEAILTGHDKNPFARIPFPSAPLGLYNGKPWFLPFAGAWYKFLDWVS